MRHYGSIVDVNQCLYGKEKLFSPCQLYFLCQHPPRLNEVLKYMSEAIISRRGYGTEGKPELRTEVITGNTNWTVPNYKKGNVSVRIFGGGGGAYGLSYVSGGSGWMNNAEFNNLTPGQIIQITIGGGGNNVNRTGGTTSFGTYLSATGGGSSSGAAGGYGGGTGWQFGGGGGSSHEGGGNGGIWGGGGGGGGTGYGSIYDNKLTFPGNGGKYGGGGGGSSIVYSISQAVRMGGGNGGMYGGGGGSGASIYQPYIHGTRYDASNNGGLGGEYGGNGGNMNFAAENGTNTANIDSVPDELKGYGIGGYQTVRSTKGFYINLYDPSYSNTRNVQFYCDGGGGYGGNGGTITNQSITMNIREYELNDLWYQGAAVSGGGGGGYGGNGGDCNVLVSEEGDSIYGGGGGGYGGDGERGTTTYGGGGGGYFSDGYHGGGGGYYNYCKGGALSYQYPESYYGSGGPSNGISGACIIQYWI